MTISKNGINASLAPAPAKEVLIPLFAVGTIAAAGSAQSDATPILSNRVVVTGADGTKGVRLPPADSEMSIDVLNSNGTYDLKVYPDGAIDIINALSATSAFTVVAGTDAKFVCTAAGQWYVRAAASLVSGLTASGAELNVLDNVVAGTVSASKGVVVDASKAVDISRATTERSLGGTGVPGAAAVQTEVTKAVTAFTDTTAKTVFTVTVPNAAHAAVIEVDCLGVLGAGGAIGAGEGVRVSKYQVTVARTAGVNAVATVSSAIGGAESHVAGAASVTSVVVTAGAVSGAVGATNTFTIQVAITKSGGASDNHTGVFTAKVLNQNASGVTIA